MIWNVCKYPECEKWSSKKDGDYCYSHARLSRKQIERDAKQKEKRSSLLQSPPKVRGRIKKVSAKREELNKEYFKLVEQFKKDNPFCKANVNEYCTEKTEDAHHRRGRGAYLLEVSTWLPVCRSCHNFIESHPNIAKEKGWSESRLATTEPHKI